MEESRDDEARADPDTHINDLPDECLVDIMSRLGEGFLRTPLGDNFTIKHPLHCALVCKRWRSLSDSAVQTVHLFRVTDAVARHLGHHFDRIESLALLSVTVEPLALLAHNTPRLKRLEFKPGFSSSVPAVAQALAKWRSLTRLDLGLHLSSRTSAEVEASLDAVGALPTLQHLSLSYFDVDLPAVCARIGAMTGLTALDLMCSQAPPAFTSNHFNTILRELVLRNIVGARLPDSLGAFSRLETLRIEHAQELTTLPDAIGQLARLTRLEALLCRQLASLPATALCHLSSLKVLQVMCCAMQAWPKNLADLPSLHTLTANFYGELPRNLNLPKSLRSLELGSLRRLSENFGNDLSRLCTLQLANCHALSELPGSMGGLGGLEVLRLHDCPALLALPLTIGMLTMLRELDLNQCGDAIEFLPDDLSQLVALETCAIGRLPGLRRLPAGIGEWRVLTRLEVSWCRLLRGLPDEGLGRLVSLRELHVTYCASLVSLPASVGVLISLQVLCLKGCEGLSLPSVVREELLVRGVFRATGSDTRLPESLAQLRSPSG